MDLLEDEGGGKARKEGPSVIAFLAVCVVISLVAAGAGFGVSATMLKPVAPAGEAAVGQADADEDASATLAGHAKSAELAANVSVVDLKPLTTNLLDPEDAWVRMELSLAFEGDPNDALAEEIHQDILAYVHTLKLYNLRGGSGFQHLMEDLNERAAIRSGGRVKRVLVRSFILE